VSRPSTRANDSETRCAGLIAMGDTRTGVQRNSANRKMWIRLIGPSYPPRLPDACKATGRHRVVHRRDRRCGGTGGGDVAGVIGQ